MKSLLVIDGDNISPTTFSSGWKNLEKESICEKVLFGDFAKTEMVKWQKFAVENNIELHHCPRNNKKQTTDLNIFIDVMTKLYEGNFDELLMKTLNDGTPAISKKIESKTKFSLINLEIGDVVFFSNTCPHRSGVNKSKNYRRILYYTYTLANNGSAYDLYFDDKEKSKNLAKALNDK